MEIQKLTSQSKELNKKQTERCSYCGRILYNDYEVFYDGLSYCTTCINFLNSL